MKKSINYVFVILHYQATKDTIECINSIYDTVEEEFSIIIVDNKSPNNSGEYLEGLYKNNKNVYVLKTEKNIGFAKGNNVGYQYAKTYLKPDFIIVINNDMILKQKQFLKNINNLFLKNQYHIAGPKIFTIKEGYNQNPSIPTFSYDKKGINKAILSRRKDLLLIKLGIYNPMRIIKILYNKFNTNKSPQEKKMKLHGSCIIFSKLYINKYNGFFSKTFMYMEEDILSYISYEENLKIMYLKELEIHHKEDVASDLVFHNNKKKLRFILSNEIDSLKEFYKIIENPKYYKKDIVDHFNC